MVYISIFIRILISLFLKEKLLKYFFIFDIRRFIKNKISKADYALNDNEVSILYSLQEFEKEKLAAILYLIEKKVLTKHNQFEKKHQKVCTLYLNFKTM